MFPSLPPVKNKSIYFLVKIGGRKEKEEEIRDLLLLLI